MAQWIWSWGVSINTLEAISKKGFWFKIEAGQRFHAKPDDASISDFKGAPQTGGILQSLEDLERLSE